MIRKLYDGAISLWAMAMAPKVLWQSLRYKKYSNSMRERLFGPKDLGDHEGKPVIWFHAVSLGESKAAIPLVQYYSKKYPNAYMLFSCSTKTAMNHIKSNLPEVNKSFYFPLDFSWVMKRLMQAYKPQMVIVLESEFWLNFLTEAKLAGAKVILANGKVSDRSFEKFLRYTFLSRPLFSQFDLLCMQSEKYAKLMKKLVKDPSKVHHTGNIKFDVKKKPMSEVEIGAIKTLLGLHLHEKVILIASSHEEEEIALINKIKNLFDKYPYIRILVAPRHPERFNRVTRELIAAGFTCEKYEERNSSRIIIVNKMGVLDVCYQVSDVVIMAGSFNGKVGGHNILEPIEFKKLTLFGPYMYSQKQIWEDVLRFEAGTQVDIDSLANKIDDYFSRPELDSIVKKNAQRLLEFVKGATERSVKLIDKVSQIS
ncbi:MAG: glycosyltransferase N-terminal domain-containing protein [Rhabdochlamydiaceae bacterium]|nr:glycosyltransferase N-terminal domain-containing protein [Candidatus Amphrikana amoebophyrae]